MPFLRKRRTKKPLLDTELSEPLRAALDAVERMRAERHCNSFSITCRLMPLSGHSALPVEPESGYFGSDKVWIGSLSGKCRLIYLNGGLK